MDALLSTEYY